MAGSRHDEWIVVTEDAKTLPVIEILTGRGFITGKSGSGKSNTASVVAEELLERGYGLLIVDTEGEYFGLKEEYELLHAGGDDNCDVKVTAEDGDEIASVAIDGNMPVVLDVSGYFDAADAEAVIESVVTHLYKREADARKPFLLMVEEMQEYLPQKGGGTDLAELLERVAKRGRKRGLGICGMSQRPSSVDKDFITQCDWMVWHRLTWETDVNVVRNILGSDRAKAVQEFEAGQGILMTEWDSRVETVRFKRKRTLDAGATPGLDRYDADVAEPVDSRLLERAGDGLSMEQLEEFESDEDETAETVENLIDPDELADEDELDVDLDLSAEAQPEAQPAEPESDLMEAVETERRRSQILAAEVKELRGVLENVDTAEQRVTATSTEVGAPTPPQPPRPPEEREGLAGNLLEFAEMVHYVTKLTWYRVKLAIHTWRTTRT